MRKQNGQANHVQKDSHACRKKNTSGQLKKEINKVAFFVTIRPEY